MSIECSECERDLRGGHDKSCSRYDKSTECPNCGQSDYFQYSDGVRDCNRCLYSWSPEKREVQVSDLHAAMKKVEKETKDRALACYIEAAKNALRNVQVAIEEGDTDEAIRLIKEALGED